MIHEIKRNRNGNRHSVCTITKNDIYSCWPVDNICPVLKVIMEPKTRFSATLDRIDNSRGYEPDNIQVISYKANSMKADANAAELKIFAEWINENYR